MRCFFPAARLALPRLLLLLTLLLAGLGRGWAQAPAWGQAVSLNPSGGSGISYSGAIATDVAGNQYVTGSFNGTLVLGSTTLVSTHYYDMFVAKRNAATGAWLWAVQIENCDGADVAVDAGGNAVVTGNITGTAFFATSPVVTTLVAARSYNAFVAKFAAGTGACVWAVQTGGNDDNMGLEVAVDASGNALVTGSFGGTISFGTGAALIALASAGRLDVFVAKFAASTGACTWAVGAGGSDPDEGNAVAVDAAGNAFVTGTFRGTASFGTGPGATTLTAVSSTANYGDLFVAKFGASAGACVWAVRAGGSGIDGGEAIAIDASGNALVAGSFSGTSTFNTSPVPTVLASAGSGDVLVAKFGASTGACAWAVQAGGNGSDIGFGVALDAGGNVVVAGTFANTARFATSPAPTLLVSAGFADVFLAKFAAGTGTCVWALGTGSSNGSTGAGVAVDAAGNASVTGSFYNTARFGNLVLVGNSSPNAATGFVAVLPGAGTLPTRAPAARPTLTLFPNPARHACQVQGTAAGAAVTVCDALGRPLARAVADASGTASLALPAGLAPGLYLVRSGGQVRRLVVE